MFNITIALWDYIVENNIATEEEVSLVAQINGQSEETILDIIYARTELRSYEQLLNEGYPEEEALNSYYCLDEEEEEEEE